MNTLWGPTFKVIIAGGRKFNDYPLLKEKLDNLLSKVCKTHLIHIVSGTANGADKLGEQYASSQFLPVIPYPADWKKHGKSAGYKRNALMADNADALVAFWDGKSLGTMHMIELAKRKGLKVRVINY
jgi:hypothetical protein